MEELVPFILGAILGALMSFRRIGRARVTVCAAVVVSGGAVATVLSGEYQTSWVYLLLDCAEAALGLVAGLAIAARLLARRNPIRMARCNRNTP
jgi:hypothetical protein